MKYMLLVAAIVGLLGLGMLSPRGEELVSQERPFVVRVPEEFPTIQAAIDAVAEGGTVLIGPGTYQENIKIAKSIRLVGAGQGLVTIESSPEAYPDWPIIDIKAHHLMQIYLANFTIRPSHGIPTGISVIGAAQVMAHQLSISNTYSGFFLSGNVTSLLSRVTLKENSQGIWSIESPLIVIDSIIESNGVGISVLFGSLIVVRSLLARNLAAIEIGGGRRGGEVARLFENAITGNEGGLYMALGPDSRTQEELRAQNQPEIGPSVVVMKGNEIVGNSRYGIALLECLRQPDPRFLSIYVASMGMKQSSIAFMEQSNKIEGNGEADLCPPDYPWPPRFRK